MALLLACGPASPFMFMVVYRPLLWIIPCGGVFVAVVSFLTKLPARRAEGRRAEGRCVACGYDLRATPRRCPECGTVPAARTVTRGTGAAAVRVRPRARREDGLPPIPPSVTSP